MKVVFVEFDMLEYWHAGTGTGMGPHLDAVVTKSPAGLPVIPGKTVKGLLREAARTAEDWGDLPAGTTDRLFGVSSEEDAPRAPGALWFTDARLPEEVEAWARAGGRALLSHLYPAIASTQLDENGIARDKSLRRIQVTVPMKLTALVEGPDEEGWVPTLTRTAPLVRSLGSHRHRGLGRVRVRAEEVRS
jgi:hypothetical protein